MIPAASRTPFSASLIIFLFTSIPLPSKIIVVNQTVYIIHCIFSFFSLEKLTYKPLCYVYLGHSPLLFTTFSILLQ